MAKQKKCEHCGSEFYYDRITAKYCADACKQQAYLDRHSQQFANIFNAEDVEIEPSTAQPIVETGAIAPNQEAITEPEVLDDSETSASPLSENMNSTYIRKMRRKPFVRPSIPKRQEISDENAFYNGLLTLIGIAVIDRMINSNIKTLKTSDDNTKKEEPIDDGGDSGQKSNDEIPKPNNLPDETAVISQNQMNSPQSEIQNTPTAVYTSKKSGNLLTKILKLFNSLLSGLHIRTNKEQKLEKPAGLPQEQMNNSQSSIADSTTSTVKIENPHETVPKAKIVDPKLGAQLLQILQSIEKTKKEKEFLE